MTAAARYITKLEPLSALSARIAILDLAERILDRAPPFIQLMITA